MAPSSKSEKARDKYKSQRKPKDHVVKLLVRGKVSGQFPQRLFRKLPPRVCVPLKSIISEEILRSGHIFLGFTKCGRYVLSYTSNCGEDDDFSFYTYQLYWWEFNLHKRLRQVRQVLLFGGEEIYSELYLTVCEWPNDNSKIVIFGFKLFEFLDKPIQLENDESITIPRCLIQKPFSGTRSSSSILANFMMSDENNRDIYITIASMPPPKPCSHCCSVPSASNVSKGSGECLEHSYVINSRYQVVYPFPTFQPAFQLKKDQVILLNTSYSLVACGISLWPGTQGQSSQILYTKRGTSSSQAVAPHCSVSPTTSSLCSHGSLENENPPSKPAVILSSTSQSQAHVGADVFKCAQGSSTVETESQQERRETDCGVHIPQDKEPSEERTQQQGKNKETRENEGPTNLPSTSAGCKVFHHISEKSAISTPSSPLTQVQSQEASSFEPGYINYSLLHFYPQQPGTPERSTGYEDDKVQLPFTVTDLKGQNLQLVTGPYNGQGVCVEQLTLDFEYLINEVIRRDAAWAPQFCSFSDYDVVILEVCPETNAVVINIGLLLLAFSKSDKEHCRPNTYHSNLQVSWDLSTGVCCTMGVGDLTEVKGQTSGSVWSSYRKSCVNTVMKWLVPERSSRYINRMTNEALHKGSSLQVLADGDRCICIVL